MGPACTPGSSRFFLVSFINNKRSVCTGWFASIGRHDMSSNRIDNRNLIRKIKKGIEGQYFESTFLFYKKKKSFSVSSSFFVSWIKNLFTILLTTSLYNRVLSLTSSSNRFSLERLVRI